MRRHRLLLKLRPTHRAIYAVATALLVATVAGLAGHLFEKVGIAESETVTLVNQWSGELTASVETGDGEEVSLGQIRAGGRLALPIGVIPDAGNGLTFHFKGPNGFEMFTVWTDHAELAQMRGVISVPGYSGRRAPAPPPIVNPPTDQGESLPCGETVEVDGVRIHVECSGD